MECYNRRIKQPGLCSSHFFRSLFRRDSFSLEKPKSVKQMHLASLPTLSAVHGDIWQLFYLIRPMTNRHASVFNDSTCSTPKSLCCLKVGAATIFKLDIFYRRIFTHRHTLKVCHSYHRQANTLNFYLS